MNSEFFHQIMLVYFHYNSNPPLSQMKYLSVTQNKFKSTKNKRIIIDINHLVRFRGIKVNFRNGIHLQAYLFL